MVNELEMPAWPEYPGFGVWIPTEVLPELTAELPGVPAVDGWLRAVPDPRRPFPAAYLEVAWLADGLFHLATVAGCTVAAPAPGQDEPALVSHWKVPLEDVSVLAQSLRSGPVRDRDDRR